MKFKEFAHLLYPIIGAGSSTDRFVRSLFDAITTEEGADVLEEISESSCKAYFNGHSGIAGIAKKLSPYIDPVEFVNYLEQFSDATTNNIYEVFHSYVPSMTKFSAAESLADLFQSIIITAASAQRGSNSHRKRKEEQARKERIKKAMSETGATVVDGFTSLTEQFLDDDKDTENIEAEVVDDAESSGAATDEEKSTVIHQQTNVIQNGENNFNLTNNGTLNFNF